MFQRNNPARLIVSWRPIIFYEISAFVLQDVHISAKWTSMVGVVQDILSKACGETVMPPIFSRPLTGVAGTRGLRPGGVRLTRADRATG